MPALTLHFIGKDSNKLLVLNDPALEKLITEHVAKEERPEGYRAPPADECYKVSCDASLLPLLVIGKAHKVMVSIRDYNFVKEDEPKPLQGCFIKVVGILP